MLCERCAAEIEGKIERLPEPRFDHDNHLVLRPAVRLSPREWRLLEIFWHRRNRLVTTESLLMLLYDGEEEPDTALIALRVHITRLRVVLTGSPYSIAAEWKRGYTLVCKP